MTLKTATERDEARKDSERLDWLEANHCDVICGDEEDQWQVDVEGTIGMKDLVGPTLRQAIDAARGEG